MDAKTFRHMIQEILDELPDDFADKIENVVFLVEAAPTASDRREFHLKSDTLLLGLYQGVPLPSRSPMAYSGALPDQIIIFQKPVEKAAGKEPEKIRAILRRTILHEIAHYFGISDRRLRDLGAY